MRAVSICAIVAGSTLPIWRTSREATTALTARQIARLGQSTPAVGATPTRSADGACELDSGTTTIRSAGEPVLSSSTETTTAGLALPGSPRRPATLVRDLGQQRCQRDSALARLLREMAANRTGHADRARLRRHVAER